MVGKPLKRFGERGRNRTFNLLIKSQLLCQLSYAPTASSAAGINFDYSIGLLRSPAPRLASQHAPKQKCDAVCTTSGNFLSLPGFLFSQGNFGPGATLCHRSGVFPCWC